MSRITSIATANGRKWSFGNRYRKRVSGARVRSRGAGFALDCVDSRMVGAKLATL